MEQYKQIAEKIKEADGILIGASNGLSIAEGYNIFANDEKFRSHFTDFQRKYGIRSLIQGSFGRFETGKRDVELLQPHGVLLYVSYTIQPSNADLIYAGKGETAFCGDF